MIDNYFPGKHQQTNKQTSQHPSGLLKHESNFLFEIELCFAFVLGRSNTTRTGWQSRVARRQFYYAGNFFEN